MFITKQSTMPHTKKKKSQAERDAVLIKLRHAILPRQRSMHARRRIEQSFLVDAIRDKLNDLSLHPCVPYIVHAKWPYRTIDAPNPDSNSDPNLPHDWIEMAARSCKSAIRQYPWALEPSPDARDLSIAALEPIARLLRDVSKWAGVER